MLDESIYAPTLSLDMSKPYAYGADVKNGEFLSVMNKLTGWHYKRCLPYMNVIDRMFPEYIAHNICDVPYLPVKLFKSLELRSSDKSNIIKTLTSSGTTGQSLSQIFLDRETSMRQTRALASIMASILGKKRWPMVIIDSGDFNKNRNHYNARVAGILGFYTYGRDHFFCLNDSLDLDAKSLQNYIEKHGDTPILLFGFTFVVWQGLYQSALRQGVSLRFPKGSLLIHGGGWKRLHAQRVDNDIFKQSLYEQFGIEHVHNYYGMVEQVGSIFIECEKGYLHSPACAEVIIRNPFTLKRQNDGEPGVIQVLSSIPLSYPGHSLLTEDVGTIHGNDDCLCGRFGSYFSVSGRLPQVELRGCSDTRVMA